MTADDVSPDPDSHGLQRAYEALVGRVVEERLAFADRVQEVLDHAQHLQAAIDERDSRIARLEEDSARLRARIDELHAELVAANDNNQALVQSRSFRLTRPLRSLGQTIRRQ